MEPVAEHRERERARFEFFLALPELDPAQLDPSHGQGRPDARAALRVLGRLRRLRRDAVPEAAVPALRRPRAGRERDRLLVDLRRQPADHAVDHQRRGPRPGVGQLAVRGQRRVRPRHAPRPRAADGGGAPAARRARAAGRRGARGRDPRRDGPRRRRDRRAARARGGAPRRLAALPRPLARGASRASPATSCARASGSSAATAGPTTSARRASTTCWPPGRDVNVLVLDTQVYSNTGGPGVEGDAARRRREVRRGRQGHAAQGPRAHRERLRQRLRRAGGARRERRADAEGASSRPTPGRARRW